MRQDVVNRFDATHVPLGTPLGLRLEEIPTSADAVPSGKAGCRGCGIFHNSPVTFERFFPMGRR